MPRLTLPQPPDTAPPRTPGPLLGRRQFLKGLALLLGAVAIPLDRVERVWAAARGRFFTRRERATLVALCDQVLPADGRAPGATALGVPTYIERLLTAFDHRVPPIFAGGPFSGRNPFPDNDDGTPSRRRPRNAFKRFIPLTRVQEIRWRAEVLGSANVPGADFNDAALGPLPGLRQVYREGLEEVDRIATERMGTRFVRLTRTQRAELFPILDRSFSRLPRRNASFIDVLVQHTLEGCFAPPEYGGNRRGHGWQLLGIEGDNQPLGFSIFSRAANGYNERPDHPMSTANPGDTGAPLSPDGTRIQNAIVQLTRPSEPQAC